MTKRLLVEYLSAEQRTEQRIENQNADEMRTKLLQNNFAALENLRELFLQGFGLLFSATGKAAEFESMIQTLEREWTRIAENNALICEQMQNQEHSQRSGTQPSESLEPLADIHEEEIEFTDLFGGSSFIIAEQDKDSSIH